MYWPIHRSVKSSMTFTNEEGEQEKEASRTTARILGHYEQQTTQLVQHIRSMLKTTGLLQWYYRIMCCLKEEQEKLFEKKNSWRPYRPSYDPSLTYRIFYANGVKANVLFFDGKPSSKDPGLKEIWVYDYPAPIFTIP